MAEKRVIQTEEKKGLQVSDIILIAVLLAAGVVQGCRYSLARSQVWASFCVLGV